MVPANNCDETSPEQVTMSAASCGTMPAGAQGHRSQGESVLAGLSNLAMDLASADKLMAERSHKKDAPKAEVFVSPAQTMRAALAQAAETAGDDSSEDEPDRPRRKRFEEPPPLIPRITVAEGEWEVHVHRTMEPWYMNRNSSRSARTMDRSNSRWSIPSPLSAPLSARTASRDSGAMSSLPSRTVSRGISASPGGGGASLRGKARPAQIENRFMPPASSTSPSHKSGGQNNGESMPSALGRHAPVPSRLPGVTSVSRSGVLAKNPNPFLDTRERENRMCSTPQQPPLATVVSGSAEKAGGPSEQAALGMLNRRGSCETNRTSLPNLTLIRGASSARPIRFVGSEAATGDCRTPTPGHTQNSLLTDGKLDMAIDSLFERKNAETESALQKKRIAINATDFREKSDFSTDTPLLHEESLFETSTAYTEESQSTTSHIKELWPSADGNSSTCSTPPSYQGRSLTSREMPRSDSLTPRPAAHLEALAGSSWDQHPVPQRDVPQWQWMKRGASGKPIPVGKPGPAPRGSGMPVPPGGYPQSGNVNRKLAPTNLMKEIIGEMDEVQDNSGDARDEKLDLAIEAILEKSKEQSECKAAGQRATVPQACSSRSPPARSGSPSMTTWSLGWTSPWGKMRDLVDNVLPASFSLSESSSFRWSPSSPKLTPRDRLRSALSGQSNSAAPAN